MSAAVLLAICEYAAEAGPCRLPAELVAVLSRPHAHRDVASGAGLRVQRFVGLDLAVAGLGVATEQVSGASLHDYLRVDVLVTPS